MKSPNNFEIFKNIRWNRFIVDENHTIHPISGWMLQFGPLLYILYRHYGTSSKMNKKKLVLSYEAA